MGVHWLEGRSCGGHSRYEPGYITFSLLCCTACEIVTLCSNNGLVTLYHILYTIKNSSMNRQAPANISVHCMQH